MSHTEYTASELADRFEEAIRTLKRLYVPGTKPRTYFNNWPPIVYTTWEIEMQDKLPLQLGPPPADKISRMEETFSWMWMVDEVDDRHLIWLRARNVPWKVICRRIGCGRTKAWRDWVYALTKLANKLNRKENKGK